MFLRLFSVLIVVCMAISPAFAGVKSATNKITDTFMELDSDQSGGVSYAEYKAMVNQRASARFRKMDANRDGAVSATEYRKFWRKTKAKWYRLKR